MQSRLFDNEEIEDNKSDETNKVGFSNDAKSVFNEQISFMKKKQSILEQLQEDPEYIRNKRRNKKL